MVQEERKDTGALPRAFLATEKCRKTPVKTSEVESPSKRNTTRLRLHARALLPPAVATRKIRQACGCDTAARVTMYRGNERQRFRITSFLVRKEKKIRKILVKKKRPEKNFGGGGGALAPPSTPHQPPRMHFFIFTPQKRAWNRRASLACFSL